MKLAPGLPRLGLEVQVRSAGINLRTQLEMSGLRAN